MVHSDLLNRNVLVAGDKISAVLDWGSSFFGDTLYDIAWFHFYEPWYPEFGRIKLPERLLQHFLDDPTTNKENVPERLLTYQLHIGLDSIAYNAFQRDWESLLEVAGYVERLG
jgi:hygromycin-B 4-O-kinase